MKQLTLRSIPEELQQAIKSQARTHGESLNKSAIRLLKQAVGLDRPSRKKRDLSAIAGCWSAREGEEFEGHMRVFEALDEELWQ